MQGAKIVIIAFFVLSSPALMGERHGRESQREVVKRPLYGSVSYDGRTGAQIYGRDAFLESFCTDEYGSYLEKLFLDFPSVDIQHRKHLNKGCAPPIHKSGAYLEKMREIAVLLLYCQSHPNGSFTGPYPPKNELYDGSDHLEELFVKLQKLYLKRNTYSSSKKFSDALATHQHLEQFRFFKADLQKMLPWLSMATENLQISENESMKLGEVLHKLIKDRFDKKWPKNYTRFDSYFKFLNKKIKKEESLSKADRLMLQFLFTDTKGERSPLADQFLGVPRASYLRQLVMVGHSKEYTGISPQSVDFHPYLKDSPLLKDGNPEGEKRLHASLFHHFMNNMTAVGLSHGTELSAASRTSPTHFWQTADIIDRTYNPRTKKNLSLESLDETVGGLTWDSYENLREKTKKYCKTEQGALAMPLRELSAQKRSDLKRWIYKKLREGNEEDAPKELRDSLFRETLYRLGIALNEVEEGKKAEDYTKKNHGNEILNYMQWTQSELDKTETKFGKEQSERIKEVADLALKNLDMNISQKTEWLLESLDPYYQDLVIEILKRSRRFSEDEGKVGESGYKKGAKTKLKEFLSQSDVSHTGLMFLAREEKEIMSVIEDYNKDLLSEESGDIQRLNETVSSSSLYDQLRRSRVDTEALRTELLGKVSKRAQDDSSDLEYMIPSFQDVITKDFEESDVRELYATLSDQYHQPEMLEKEVNLRKVYRSVLEKLGEIFEDDASFDEEFKSLLIGHTPSRLIEEEEDQNESDAKATESTEEETEPKKTPEKWEGIDLTLGEDWQMQLKKRKGADLVDELKKAYRAYAQPLTVRLEELGPKENFHEQALFVQDRLLNSDARQEQKKRKGALAFLLNVLDSQGHERKLLESSYDVEDFAKTDHTIETARKEIKQKEEVLKSLNVHRSEKSQLSDKDIDREMSRFVEEQLGEQRSLPSPARTHWLERKFLPHHRSREETRRSVESVTRDTKDPVLIKKYEELLISPKDDEFEVTLREKNPEIYDHMVNVSQEKQLRKRLLEHLKKRNRDGRMTLEFKQDLDDLAVLTLLKQSGMLSAIISSRHYDMVMNNPRLKESFVEIRKALLVELSQEAGKDDEELQKNLLAQAYDHIKQDIDRVLKNQEEESLSKEKKRESRSQARSSQGEDATEAKAGLGYYDFPEQENLLKLLQKEWDHQSGDLSSEGEELLSQLAVREVYREKYNPKFPLHKYVDYLEGSRKYAQNFKKIKSNIVSDLKSGSIQKHFEFLEKIKNEEKEAEQKKLAKEKWIQTHQEDYTKNQEHYNKMKRLSEDYLAKHALPDAPVVEESTLESGLLEGLMDNAQKESYEALKRLRDNKAEVETELLRSKKELRELESAHTLYSQKRWDEQFVLPQDIENKSKSNQTKHDDFVKALYQANGKSKRGEKLSDKEKSLLRIYHSNTLLKKRFDRILLLRKNIKRIEEQLTEATEELEETSQLNQKRLDELYEGAQSLSFDIDVAVMHESRQTIREHLDIIYPDKRARQFEEYPQLVNMAAVLQEYHQRSQNRELLPGEEHTYKRLNERFQEKYEDFHNEYQKKMRRYTEIPGDIFEDGYWVFANDRVNEAPNKQKLYELYNELIRLQSIGESDQESDVRGKEIQRVRREIEEQVALIPRLAREKLDEKRSWLERQDSLHGNLPKILSSPDFQTFLKHFRTKETTKRLNELSHKADWDSRDGSSTSQFYQEKYLTPLLQLKQAKTREYKDFERGKRGWVESMVKEGGVELCGDLPERKDEMTDDDYQSLVEIYYDQCRNEVMLEVENNYVIQNQKDQLVKGLAKASPQFREEMEDEFIEEMVDQSQHSFFSDLNERDLQRELSRKSREARSEQKENNQKHEINRRKMNALGIKVNETLAGHTILSLDDKTSFELLDPHLDFKQEEHLRRYGYDLSRRVIGTGTPVTNPDGRKYQRQFWEALKKLGDKGALLKHPVTGRLVPAYDGLIDYFVSNQYMNPFWHNKWVAGNNKSYYYRDFNGDLQDPYFKFGSAKKLEDELKKHKEDYDTFKYKHDRLAEQEGSFGQAWSRIGDVLSFGLYDSVDELGRTDVSRRRERMYEAMNDKNFKFYDYGGVLHEGKNPGFEVGRDTYQSETLDSFRRYRVSTDHLEKNINFAGDLMIAGVTLIGPGAVYGGLKGVYSIANAGYRGYKAAKALRGAQQLSQLARGGVATLRSSKAGERAYQFMSQSQNLRTLAGAPRATVELARGIKNSKLIQNIQWANRATDFAKLEALGSAGVSLGRTASIARAMASRWKGVRSEIMLELGLGAGLGLLQPLIEKGILVGEIDKVTRDVLKDYADPKKKDILKAPEQNDGEDIEAFRQRYDEWFDKYGKWIPFIDKDKNGIPDAHSSEVAAGKSPYITIAGKKIHRDAIGYAHEWGTPMITEAIRLAEIPISEMLLDRYNKTAGLLTGLAVGNLMANNYQAARGVLPEDKILSTTFEETALMAPGFMAMRSLIPKLMGGKYLDPLLRKTNQLGTAASKSRVPSLPASPSQASGLMNRFANNGERQRFLEFVRDKLATKPWLRKAHDATAGAAALWGINYGTNYGYRYAKSAYTGEPFQQKVKIHDNVDEKWWHSWATEVPNAATMLYFSYLMSKSAHGLAIKNTLLKTDLSDTPYGREAVKRSHDTGREVDPLDVLTEAYWQEVNKPKRPIFTGKTRDQRKVDKTPKPFGDLKPHEIPPMIQMAAREVTPREYFELRQKAPDHPTLKLVEDAIFGPATRSDLNRQQLLTDLNDFNRNGNVDHILNRSTAGELESSSTGRLNQTRQRVKEGVKRGASAASEWASHKSLADSMDRTIPRFMKSLRQAASAGGVAQVNRLNGYYDDNPDLLNTLSARDVFGMKKRPRALTPGAVGDVALLHDWSRAQIAEYLQITEPGYTSRARDQLTDTVTHDFMTEMWKRRSDPIPRPVPELLGEYLMSRPNKPLLNHSESRRTGSRRPSQEPEIGQYFESALKKADQLGIARRRYGTGYSYGSSHSFGDLNDQMSINFGKVGQAFHFFGVQVDYNTPESLVEGLRSVDKKYRDEVMENHPDRLGQQNLSESEYNEGVKRFKAASEAMLVIDDFKRQIQRDIEQMVAESGGDIKL